MLTWILQTTIISVIFIFLVHHLFEFFKSTLTVPKIKDLVNSPTQKYENMLNIITHNGNHSSTEMSSSTSINQLGLLPCDDEPTLLPKPDVESMKNELKSFLKQQLNSGNNNNNNSSQEISNIDFSSANSMPNYSNY